ncbi:protein-disulfide reductase DsbD [Luteimonas sp. MC1782]|uniref:protein-disulfide reductase DsbD family protein n=1 Tax=Luteimonas sp. MC1782 TaxID=2760305 RepID=UPI0016030AD4|nr:protein-disulfide reductase DsbD [Luteimonas sp. MC1782]MBB1472915.1 protein-disulfide reductase DsbD [Luteimonas sp. MC1782]
MSAAGWRRTCLALALLVLPCAAIAAVDVDDLLPVDEAFVLRAEATDAGRIELAWTIADGYYLYRHRMGAEPLDAGFDVDARGLQLPAGRRHTDEFFGEVETYRGRVAAVLTGQAGTAGSTRLKVRYQGCADLGVCYPPQTRTVTVALPGSRSPAAPDAGFAALGRTLGGGTAQAGAAARPLGGKADALPLPQEQAFAFEAIAGDGNTVLMRFTPAPGYYLYRDRSSFQLHADGITPAAPRWPRGVSHHDEHFGDVVVYFDQVDVPLPLLRTHGEARQATLTATFQGCQDEGICYPPMTRSVRLSLPAGTVTPASPLAATPIASPGAATPPAAAPPEGSSSGAGAPAAGPGDTAAGTLSTSGGLDDPAAEPGAPASSADAAGDNAARSTPPATAATGVLAALLLALVGGLLLNVMPCVLPILSLKVLGIAQTGADRGAARRHALWYTAGVLSAFAVIGLLVIALRAAGQALGWGFQLQQPGFVAALVLLMAAVGLSLSGVFTIGGSANLGRGLATRSGPLGDFFTGVLACVVASPCIAPFMGGALAFAFAAPTVVALAVFLALGLGLALPFLLVGFVPGLAERLPKPGAWMETLKQVLAFPMYLTAIWLAWVLGKQRGVDAMALVAIGVALMALALWWFERARMRGGWRRLPALALLLVALAPVWLVTRMPPPDRAPQQAGEATVAYSAARLQALRDEGRVVFVNMTADWCVTCKANERGTLSSAAFRDALQRAGATYMVGDWTNVDPEISAFLAAHRAVGVPLYVVYPRGGGAGEVLPAVLDRSSTVAAIERAAR